MSNIPRIHLVSSDSPESQGGNDLKKQDTSGVSQEFNFKVNIDVSTHLDNETKQTITRLEQENSELKSKVIALHTQCDVLQCLEKENQKTTATLQLVVEKQAKDILSLSEENEALLHNFGVIDVRLDGTIFAMNERMEKISGYSFDEVRGKNMSVMSSGTHDKNFWNSVFEVIHAGHQWRGDIRNKKKDGTFQWLDTIIFPMTDSRGFTFFRVARSDVSEIQEKNIQLRALLNNEIDPITGLPTTQQMYKDYAKKSPKRLSILHINDMKYINTAYGEPLGDRIFQKIAKVLTKYAIGHPELGIGVYRLLGSDFAIVYNSDIKNEFAKEQYSKLQNIVLGNFGSIHPDPHFTITPTFSFGIATDEPDIYRSLQNAELALEATKGQSNGVTIYNKDLDIGMAPEKVIQLKEDITYAFNNDGFILHFQPIVKVNHYGKLGELFSRVKKRWFPKNETENFKHEILVRMKDMNDSSKIISPGDFLGILEEDGKNIQLTTRVIDLACEFMLENPGQYSLNLTKEDLNHEGRAEEIIKQIESYHLSPSRFTWEILENIEFLTPVAFSNIEYFHKHGCKISIDDYGTGFSSISRLRKTKANTLKIDMTLTRGIDKNPDSIYDVRSAIKMAHGLHAKVIAEGVETEGEKQVLIDLGIHFMQGYLFGKPKDHI